jgi:hypothetical protein
MARKQIFIFQKKDSGQLQGLSQSVIRKFGAGHGIRDHFQLFLAGTEIKSFGGRKMTWNIKKTTSESIKHHHQASIQSIIQMFNRP